MLVGHVTLPFNIRTSMISISTAWNYKEDKDTRQILTEIKNVGLDTIELGYLITKDKLETIIPLLSEMDMKVSSIHNFCPLPYDAPSPRHPSNHYRLSSLDEDERKRAVKWTNNTVDLAKQVGAKVVVVHAGTIELDNDPSRELIDMYKAGKKDAPEFAPLREKLLKVRKEKIVPYLDAAVKSFKEILPHAANCGIKIGFETRYYPIEIPNFEEIGIFLDTFKDQSIGYWHDVGHAEANSRLGITDQMKYLNAYKDRMIGIHIHGIEVLRDHKAPFVGDMDFAPILPFITDGMIKVIESSSVATSDEIREAVKKLSRT